MAGWHRPSGACSSLGSGVEPVLRTHGALSRPVGAGDGAPLNSSQGQPDARYGVARATAARCHQRGPCWWIASHHQESAAGSALSPSEVHGFSHSAHSYGHTPLFSFVK